MNQELIHNQEYIKQYHLQFQQSIYMNKHLIKYFGQNCQLFQDKLRKQVNSYYKQKKTQLPEIKEINDEYVGYIQKIQEMFQSLASQLNCEYQSKVKFIKSTKKYQQMQTVYSKQVKALQQKMQKSWVGDQNEQVKELANMSQKIQSEQQLVISQLDQSYKQVQNDAFVSLNKISKYFDEVLAKFQEDQNKKRTQLYKMMNKETQQSEDNSYNKFKGAVSFNNLVVRSTCTKFTSDFAQNQRPMNSVIREIPQFQNFSDLNRNNQQQEVTQNSQIDNKDQIKIFSLEQNQNRSSDIEFDREIQTNSKTQDKKMKKKLYLQDNQISQFKFTNDQDNCTPESNNKQVFKFQGSNNQNNSSSLNDRTKLTQLSKLNLSQIKRNWNQYSDYQNKMDATNKMQEIVINSDRDQSQTSNLQNLFKDIKINNEKSIQFK